MLVFVVSVQFVSLTWLSMLGEIPIAPNHSDEGDAHVMMELARRSGQRHCLGDRLRVRVETVDQVKGWINFTLVTHRKEKRTNPRQPEKRVRRSDAPTRRRERRRRP